MIARVNFLLGLGLLILIAFYGAGAWLLLPLVELSAPAWVVPAGGATVLAALALTVQFLSMAMDKLPGIGVYEPGERAGLVAYSGQAALILGHLAVIYALQNWLLEAVPVSPAELLTVVAFYAAGSMLAYLEWKRRKHARG